MLKGSGRYILSAILASPLIFSGCASPTNRTREYEMAINYRPSAEVDPKYELTNYLNKDLVREVKVTLRDLEETVESGLPLNMKIETERRPVIGWKVGWNKVISVIFPEDASQ